MVAIFLTCLASIVVLVRANVDIEKPNIVFISADDLGWNDVSIHGSDQIMTPNIDILGYDGFVFTQYYTDTQGTASSSALYTGKYPLRLGTQGDSIKASEDRGIPTAERLMPIYLGDLGYETHLIGKWHVGKSREHFLPTFRGFGTFYGFLGGSVDYYTYSHIENWNETSLYGLDLFENEVPVENHSGHLTDLITEQAVQVIRDHDVEKPLYLHVSHAAPHSGGGMVTLQSPENTIAANSHIAHSARRLYAGLVTSVDRCVGNIVGALAEKDMLRNTLIVFVSDNGAPTIGPDQNFGSNFPLRGVKSTPWDGAARSIALLWHSALQPEVSNGLFHVTDWLPTLVSAAGGEVNETIDGVNQWNSISKGEDCKRNNVLITIDDINGWAAYREGDLKMIVGDFSKSEYGKKASKHRGQELKELRHEGPVYEEALLESEVYRIFKETLDINIDINNALTHRNDNMIVDYTQNKLEDEEYCVPTEAKGCLFNVSADPLETQDLWNESPEIVQRMILRLRTLWTELKPRNKPEFDERANPANRNYTWTPWLDNDEPIKEPPKIISNFPLRVTSGELQYLVDLNVDSFTKETLRSVKLMKDKFTKTISGLFPI